jgi:hypothetical protein
MSDGKVKNLLSLVVMCLIMRMEKAIMLEGFLLPNAVFIFLLKCHTVIPQAILKLLKFDIFELG